MHKGQDQVNFVEVSLGGSKKYDVTHSVDLYSGQILVWSMSVSFRVFIFVILYYLPWIFQLHTSSTRSISKGLFDVLLRFFCLLPWFRLIVRLFLESHHSTFDFEINTVTFSCIFAENAIWNDWCCIMSISWCILFQIILIFLNAMLCKCN